MNAEQLKALREKAKLNQSDFGRLVGLGRKMIGCYEAGEQYIPVTRIESMRLLEFIVDNNMLAKYVKKNHNGSIT